MNLGEEAQIIASSDQPTEARGLLGLPTFAIFQPADGSIASTTSTVWPTELPLASYGVQPVGRDPPLGWSSLELFQMIIINHHSDLEYFQTLLHCSQLHLVDPWSPAQGWEHCLEEVEGTLERTRLAAD